MHEVFGLADLSGDRTVKKRITFDHPIIMNYLRMYVKHYHFYPSARWEIYGCDYTVW